MVPSRTRYRPPITRTAACGLLIALLALATGLPLHAAAQASPDAWTVDRANLRTGPGLAYEIVTVLPAGTGITLQGRSADSRWARGVTQSGAQGWIARDVLRLSDGVDLTGLPRADHNADADFLNTIPVLPAISPHADVIFRQGHALGNQSNVFTSVGDCNSDTRAYLYPLDHGQYDLGRYTTLQDTVDFFAGSFDHTSVAGRFGYNTMTVLDPMFADPQYCEPDASSLTCEYRRMRPSVAIVMFGANDVVGLTDDEYRAALGTIIETSLEQGIIPVLNTFPWCSNDRSYDKALRLNVITVDLAASYDVPLVNFWRAAQPLRNCGFAPSSHHLTQSGAPNSAPFVTFNGEESEYGMAMRNYLTLETLDRIRRSVIEPAGLP